MTINFGIDNIPSTALPSAEFFIDNMDTQRMTIFGRTFNKQSLIIAGSVIVVVLLLLGFLAVRKTTQSSNAPISADNKITLQKAKATQDLKKEFTFALKDTSGKDVSTFKYSILSVEKRDEIIVKGKRAVAVEGRTFLIVNLKIRNDFSKPVSINARDYVRLTVNNTSDKLAADIHNDPVEVQPDSTKETRLGFPINDSDKNLTLIVGELSGKKETIKLNLK